jgi:hypothetical protein
VTPAAFISATNADAAASKPPTADEQSSRSTCARPRPQQQQQQQLPDQTRTSSPFFRREKYTLGPDNYKNTHR